VLGLDRPVSASSNSLFEGLPNILHPILLWFSIFWASFCPFLLHVVDNLIRICLVSRRLALISNLPEFLHFFCGQDGFTRLSSWKPFISVDVNRVLSFYLKVQISLRYQRFHFTTISFM
jgi:hypothetical protein